MKILAIECTHGFASVAVSNAGNVAEQSLAEWQKTAEALVPLVEQVMAEAGLQPDDLNGVAVSSGPGSFTALRIGMSVAKGIAFGAGLPLAPVSTLAALASSVLPHTDAQHIVPVIPSRAGECFAAIFWRDGDELVEAERFRCDAAELPGRLASLGEEFAIAGRGVQALAEDVPELALCCIEASFFSALSLLPFARKALAKGGGESSTEAAPDYRQAFVPKQVRS
ncbi:MAG TPA: tRNA (adenosine(37)-N6)-threonylcarbamoyltransferase complex dimerization subunit type 1 TsaB [Chlorobaculum parvum]|uniref:tRNA (Adenosine(37)-N6)-threonylcarbamoyltransferase complex dimerization subunit type 1 TsaB n=1 Tax=Chlorobaculum parvum TaxID=274539 RepID=A0A7C5DDK6_9CHLB|nr:tRNA (adenosine(37)-N6)-threonylcarbamoyltransferase complex dimerization subunit type 1 TsaB [Chlorobaculum parvum]